MKQTLNYAIAVRAASKTRRLFSRDDTVDLFRDVLCSIFGLRHTYNTKVGNECVVLNASCALTQPKLRSWRIRWRAQARLDRRDARDARQGLVPR